MLKKVLLLGLSLLLVLYPSAVFAAELDVQQNNNQSDTLTTEESTDGEAEIKTEETDLETEVTGEPIGEEASTESTNLPIVNNEEAEQEELTPTQTEEQENKKQTNEKESSVTSELDSSDGQANEQTSLDPGTDLDSNAIDSETDEVEKTQEQTAKQSSEELDLTQVYGAINERETIQYDFNKGYYVLNLQAGLTNMSGNQVLNQKWVAFALPDGVYLATEDVPAGVVQIPVNGKNGVAIKIPDVMEFPDSQLIYLEIPLVGEPNDNDPVENLYLYDVNADEFTYDNLGQIDGQRNIDFTSMQGTPELEIDSTITGTTSFNNEEGYYELDLTVNSTNNTESNISEIYGGFRLPDDVKLLQNAPDGVEVLQLDNGSEVLALKLPELEPGESGEVSYKVPLIGKTIDSIQSSSIGAYKINGSFQEIGRINGSVYIDLSTMNESWDISAKSQIVKDFPGLDSNQFGLRFSFVTRNLTIHDIDRVKIEFQVPHNITIQEPDSYNQGEIPDSLKDFMDENATSSEDLDLSWNGNTATINLDTVDGSTFYQGFFTAFGETSTTLEDLEGLEVLVTLYQNGEEVVKELHVPFEIVSYEGDDGDSENPDQGQTPGNEDNDDVDEDQSSDDKNQDGENKDSNKDDNQSDDGNQPNNDNQNNDDQLAGSKDGDNDNSNNNNESKTAEGSKGAELPNTATNMYSWLLYGAILTIAGIILLFIKKRKIA